MRKINVTATIDVDLFDGAKARHLNLSKLFNDALQKEIGKAGSDEDAEELLSKARELMERANAINESNDKQKEKVHEIKNHPAVKQRIMGARYAMKNNPSAFEGIVKAMLTSLKVESNIDLNYKLFKEMVDAE